MSLRRLVKLNKFTVETNRYALQMPDGSLDRKYSWIPIYLNVDGFMQATVTTSAKGKDDTTKEFNQVELESFYTIFHIRSDIIFNTDNRILMHRDPRKKLQFDVYGFPDLTVHSRSDIRIFEFIGAREPGGDRRAKLSHFELYLKEIFRQEI